ncbi:MAG: arsenate reductase family protein [bacterium]|nr:arsenate reductase family protein [bacterium]
MTSSESIYLHNPRCSKSREGLALLKEKGIEVRVREYLKDPLDRDEIVALAKALELHPSEFVRQNEKDFEEATGGNTDFSVEEWSEIIETHPHFLQRPILISQGKAVIGRPTEMLQTLL